MPHTVHCVYLVQPVDSGGTGRGVGRNGEGKVRDKRLENGIGHPHACHDFFKGGQICEEGGGLSDTGSPVPLHIVQGE